MELVPFFHSFFQIGNMIPGSSSHLRAACVSEFLRGTAENVMLLCNKILPSVPFFSWAILLLIRNPNLGASSKMKYFLQFACALLIVYNQNVTVIIQFKKFPIKK